MSVGERLTHHLHAEHTGLLERIHAIAATLDDAAEAAPDGAAAAAMGRDLEALTRDLSHHALLEDDALLAILQPEVLQRGGISLVVFEEEHRDVHRLLQEIASALRVAASSTAPDLRGAAASARHLTGVCEDHFRREEDVLFPLADEVLSDEAWGEVERLAREL